MSTLRRSKSRSHIAISPLPPGALAEPDQEPPEAHLSRLDAGLPTTRIYRRPRLHFFARFLSDLPLEQVYRWETGAEPDEEFADEEEGLFALHWNGKDLLDAVITLSELQREVRVNGERINPVSGRKLSNSDSIKIGPPQSAPHAGDVELIYKFDALFIPSREEPDRTPYKVLGWLGDGSFGQVARVQNSVNQRFYAVKRVKTADSEKEETLREPLLWRDLVHECVCQYSRHWVDADDEQKGATIYTVMDYAPYGTFFDFIGMNRRNKRADPSDVVNRRVASQICRAFDYLHGEDIAHCDFKPDNVVIERLDADGYPEKVVIIDFGLALRLGHLNELEVAVEEYRAPEIGLKDAKITFKVDSFAIAATLHYFVTNGRELVQDPSSAPAVQGTNTEETTTQSSATSGNDLDELVEDSESLEDGDSSSGLAMANQDTDSQETNTQCSVTSGDELDELVEDSESMGLNGDSGSGLVVPNRGLSSEEKNKVRIMHLEDLDFNEILKDFITCMSLEDPAERMSPGDALKHPWLQPRVSPELIPAYIEEIDSEDAEVDELDSEGAEDDGSATAKRTRSQRSDISPSMTSQGRYDPRARLDSEEGRM